MKHYLLLAVAAALFINGCAKESSRPEAKGEGAVRALNAIATSPDFAFLIEESSRGTVGFKRAGDTFRWDALGYTFNFEVLLAGETARTRVASIFIDVERDRDYTLLLGGAIASPDINVWESAIREWQDSDTTYEVRFANASPALGPVDVYFDLTGTAPAVANKLGTLDYGEILPAQEYSPGERSLVLTAVDDPATVLYESTPLVLTQRTSYILSPFDADANDVGPVPVLLINTTQGGGGPIASVDSQPTARFFHASRDMGSADIYVDDPLTAPLVTNHNFGDVTSDIPIQAGDLPITYTTAGNTGSILIDGVRNFSIDSHHSMFALRTPDGDDVLGKFVIDRRSVETRAKMTLTNTSADNAVVDVYLLREEDTLEDSVPVMPSLSSSAGPTSAPLLPNQYDLYLTVQFEKTVLLGPIPLDTETGDVIEGVIYDTVDPNVPDLEFVPLP
jgi:hypothetical protein